MLTPSSCRYRFLLRCEAVAVLIVVGVVVAIAVAAAALVVVTVAPFTVDWQWLLLLDAVGQVLQQVHSVAELASFELRLFNRVVVLLHC